MRIGRSFSRDDTIDGDLAGLVHTELGSFDEVREVRLEERLPRPPLRRAEGGTGFGRRIAEQLGEGVEHRETMLVIRLAGQSRGQALGRGLRSAKGP